MIERADGHLPANVAVIPGSRKQGRPGMASWNSPPVPLRAIMLYGVFEAAPLRAPKDA
jgi:hypothetical protein